MSDMILFGNSLGKKYKTNPESDVVSDADKSQAQKDREALRKHAEAKRAEREARMNKRDSSRKPLIAEEKEKLLTVKDRIVTEAKAKTNHLARKYGLKEPNNPEALVHDRYHCYKCDMKLHIPNAYKNLPDEVQAFFEDDNEVRHLCCFCFGNMEQVEIMKIQDGESDKKIRMMIYNPEDGAKEEVEKVTKAIQAKIKQYDGIISLIGTVKHDYLQEVDDLENTVIYHAPTRYNYGDR